MTLEDYITKHSTVAEFASRLGKSRQQIYRYMRGENLTKRIIDDINVATGGKVKPAAFFETPKERA